MSGDDQCRCAPSAGPLDFLYPGRAMVGDECRVMVRQKGACSAAEEARLCGWKGISLLADPHARIPYSQGRASPRISGPRAPPKPKAEQASGTAADPRPKYSFWPRLRVTGRRRLASYAGPIVIRSGATSVRLCTFLKQPTPRLVPLLYLHVH